MNRVLTAMLAAALGSPAQAAPEQIDLVPSGKWRIDYADNGCVLSRPFTANGQEYKLGLSFEPLASNVWMTIHSPDTVNRRDDGDAKVEIDGAAMKDPVHFNVFKDKPSGTIREYWLKKFQSNVGTTKQFLRLETGRYGDIRIDFDGFAEAMKSIGTCVDDLHRSLGIDPALLKTIATPPEGFAGSIVELPQFNDSFTFQMIYWVAPSGRVDECHLLAPTGKSNFDKNACEQLKKNARFKPAKNAADAAIRAPVYENNTVRTTVIRSP